MTRSRLGWIGLGPLMLGALLLGGCVGHIHTENAALTMPWPAAPAAALTAHAAPNPDYPTVGGDILKGTAPADLEAARAAAIAQSPPEISEPDATSPVAPH